MRSARLVVVVLAVVGCTGGVPAASNPAQAPSLNPAAAPTVVPTATPTPVTSTPGGTVPPTAASPTEVPTPSLGSVSPSPESSLRPLADVIAGIVSDESYSSTKASQVSAAFAAALAADPQAAALVRDSRLPDHTIAFELQDSRGLWYHCQHQTYIVQESADHLTMPSEATSGRFNGLPADAASRGS